MTAQLWEWAVQQETRNRPVGVCSTKHAAMDALSKALIGTGQPAQGHIARIRLIRPVHRDPFYMREPPQQAATYDGTTITWIPGTAGATGAMKYQPATPTHSWPTSTTPNAATASNPAASSGDQQ